MSWIKKLAALIIKLFSLKPTTGEPMPTPVDEYVYRAGDAVEIPVSIFKGELTGEFWVPEGPRGTAPWERGNLFAIAGPQGTCFELRGYKAKACNAGNCHEPRYNLKWSQWRKVHCTWNPQTFSCDIDGTKVTATMSGPAMWGGQTVRVVYGDKHGNLLAGAKVRSLVVSSVPFPPD